jgi:hypothetical protein
MNEKIMVKYDDADYMYKKLGETDFDFKMRMGKQHKELVHSLTEEDKNQFEALSKKIRKSTKGKTMVAV